MSGFEMVLILLMIFSIRILVPIGVVSGVSALLRKFQPAA